MASGGIEATFDTSEPEAQVLFQTLFQPRIGVIYNLLSMVTGVRIDMKPH